MMPDFQKYLKLRKVAGSEGNEQLYLSKFTTFNHPVSDSTSLMESCPFQVLLIEMDRDSKKDFRFLAIDIV